MRSINCKIVIDVMLIMALLLSMTYLLIGIDNHEIIGSVFLILCVVHIILNRKWFFYIFKGKYSVSRIFLTGLNVLIFVMIVGLMVSGLIFATYTPSSIKTADSIDIARIMHLITSYWCFVLLAIHLGVNLGTISNVIKVKNIYKEIFRLIGILLACYGVFAFMKHNFLSYMFFQQEFVFFDMKQSLMIFLLDYISILSFGTVVGYSVMRFLTKINLYKMNKQMKTKEEID